MADNKKLGERLTIPLSLEDGAVPGIAKNLLNFGSIIVLVAIIWATFAEVRELAVTEGNLVPAGSETIVEHLEGGIIREVLVREGDIVEIGAPLLRLEAIATTSDLEQLTTRAIALRFEKQRLRAIVNNTTPDFSGLNAKHPEIAANQQSLFDSQKQLAMSRRKVAIARIEQKKAEVTALKSQRDSVGGQLMIEREQLTMRTKVFEEGFTSRKDFLEVQSSFRQAEAQLASIEGQLAGTREQLAEAQNQLTENAAEEKRKLLEDQARVNKELSEAEQNLLKFQDKSDRLYIRSPVRGAVIELATKSVGKVLRPGDVAARIVPAGQEIVAEVQVKPRDIAYVNTGLDAEITVTALDPTVFGKFVGKVSQVSPSTFTTDEGETYYRAIIKINDDDDGSQGQSTDLLPGMVVQANIVTGSKSIARYLLKPIFKGLDSSFGER